MQPPPKSFVSSYDRISNVLQNRVHITQAFNPSTITDTITPQSLGAKEYSAIWDTGATNTIITQRVVNELSLKQVGRARLHTASDEKDAPTYLVAIFLPNLVYIHELMVAQAAVTSDAEVLIGMDIIGKGDFAVTNHQGKTHMSFRMPSVECIDFVKQEP